MPNVIYAMGGVSAGGYIAGPDGKSGWSMPDEERRLYETMVYWATPDKDPSVSTTTAAVGTR